MNKKQFIKLVRESNIVEIDFYTTVGNSWTLTAKNIKGSQIILEGIFTYKEFKKKLNLFQKWLKEYRCNDIS